MMDVVSMVVFYAKDNANGLEASLLAVSPVRIIFCKDTKYWSMCNKTVA
jgi:hypothetical protein